MRLLVRNRFGRILERGSAGRWLVWTGMLHSFSRKKGEAVMDCLKRIFNVFMNFERVPEEYREACIVPLFKGKKEKKKLANYSGLSLLSILGEVYGG